MGTKNTGKPSEELFDDAWASLGKRAFCFAFTDASEATGTNKRTVKIKAQPSDRIIVVDGVTQFAEVKSTIDPRNFCFKLLRVTQSAYAKMIQGAGGTYNVYVHSLHHDQWFRIPYRHIQLIKDGGKASIPWADLAIFSWSLPCSQTV